jgi:hypothetical protein
VPTDQVQQLVDQYNTLVAEKNQLLGIVNEMKMQFANHSVELASRDTEIKRLNGLIQQIVGGNQPDAVEEE